MIRRVLCLSWSLFISLVDTRNLFFKIAGCLVFRKKKKETKSYRDGYSFQLTKTWNPFFIFVDVGYNNCTRKSIQKSRYVCKKFSFVFWVYNLVTCEVWNVWNLLPVLPCDKCHESTWTGSSVVEQLHAKSLPVCSSLTSRFSYECGHSFVSETTAIT